MGKKRHRKQHAPATQAGARPALSSAAGPSPIVAPPAAQVAPPAQSAPPANVHPSDAASSPATASLPVTASSPAVPSSPAAARPHDPARARRRTWRVVGLSAVGVGLVALGYHLRSIINPLLLSLFLAYMLSPIVDFFERRGIPRALCIGALYLVLLGTLAVIVVLAVPAAFAQAESLYGVLFRGDQFDDPNQNQTWDPGETLTVDWNANGKHDASLLDRSIAKAGEWVKAWNDRFPDRKVDVEIVYTQARDWARKHVSEITTTGVDVGGSVARGVRSGIAGLFDVVSYLVLVPVYIFFFLLGINHLRDAFFEHLPGQYRDDVQRIFGKIHLALSSFFRGKLLVCLTKGLITFVGLWIVGVKFSLVFGMLQAVGSLIPFVILIVGFVPAEVVVVMDQGWAWWPMLATAGVFLLAEAAEAVLTPVILGKEVGLHPLTLIVALMIGGQLFGFFGVLMSVPLASVAKILFEEFVLPPLRALAAERPEPATAED